MKTVEQYFDAIASDAQAIVDDLRSTDTQVVLRKLSRECEAAPLRMAQIVMALAAWVNPDETLAARGERVEAITNGNWGTP